MPGQYAEAADQLRAALVQLDFDFLEFASFLASDII
jgi:hypothetical protein